MTLALRRLLLVAAVMALAWALVAAFAPSPGALAAAVAAGAMFAVAWQAWRDQRRARRLIDWLRDPRTPEPEREGAFWGEIAYRVARALRQRERALAEERQRLEQFFTAIEASPNGVLLLDADDQIAWCNRAAADHFGLDPQRDRLQRITNLVRHPVFVEHMQAGDFTEPVTISDPVAMRNVVALVRPYGSGQKLVLSQDMTERERAEAMRRDFVANVSHEIRTPLTVLAGFVETLGAVPMAEVERQRVLHLMGQQAARMQTLVDDLLTLARLEGSPRPPTDRWHDLGALLRRVEADAAALSMGRHALRFAGDPGVQVAGEDGELLSAVGNLVNNAVRYTPEGGKIDVAVRWRGDGRLEIDVADTGIGIAREHLPRLSERFYRVDSSRSRETGGTGLGLAIVKHVAQRHGGQLELESEPGRGSRFRLVLPAARLRRAPLPAGNEPATA